MSLIVITGASQGIGAAVAEAFAALPGATLALLARNPARLEAVALRCRQQGAVAQAYPCDVTNDTAVQQTATTVLRDLGPPDVLVNNAGVFQPGSLLETTPADFRAQLAINLTSAFVVTQAFLPSMMAARRGTLFFLASIASLRAYPGGVAYGTAKHGLLGLARAVREETKPFGLRVTAVLPGATWTPSWDGTPLPESRFMPAEDIARTLVDIYQLSDRTVVEEVLLRPQPGDIE
jgi:NAD(P)-dependent dehydrogenase (short-subunit alcohol dehydrogenase family)